MRYKFEEAKKILDFKNSDIIEITYSDITQTGSFIEVITEFELNYWYDVIYTDGENNEFYARFDYLDLAVNYANDCNLFPNYYTDWRTK